MVWSPRADVCINFSTKYSLTREVCTNPSNLIVVLAQILVITLGLMKGNNFISQN